MRAVLPEIAGTIQVIGTPAEEKGGGKALMVEAGVFANVDVAMLVHPGVRNSVGGRSLACYGVTIEFFGKAAHAAAQPEAGINALAALLLTFSNINALRQHLRDDARINAIITHGGKAPNIVPDYAAGRFGIRALDTPYATEILEKVRACAEGAAMATGAQYKFELNGPRYDPMAPNPHLATLVEDNMTQLGLDVTPVQESGGRGSSDMGNVSQVVPALHPSIAIAPEGSVVGHTAEFCAAAASPGGYEAMLRAAKVMAMTAVDLLAEPANMREVKRAFVENDA